METPSMVAFSDELEKISGVPGGLKNLANSRSSMTRAKAFSQMRLEAHQKGTEARKRLSALSEHGKKSIVGKEKRQPFSNLQQAVANRNVSRNILEKKSSAGHAAVDIAGLGILGVPSIQKLRGKKMDDHTAHKYELAGLGTLAGGVAHEHRKDFAAAAKSGAGSVKNVAQKGFNAAKKFVKRAAPLDMRTAMSQDKRGVQAMMGTGASAAKPAKMVQDPNRAAMMSHFTEEAAKANAPKKITPLRPHTPSAKPSMAPLGKVTSGVKKPGIFGKAMRGLAAAF